ncbi:MAG: alpha/beta hydrolase [Bacteroides sp.]|nr:alpha/beta hydrolase [Bacteroides sp.]
MNRKRKQIIESSEVSWVREAVLNGFTQKIMLDGKKKTNPAVICLHGGPGSPIPFSVGCRGLFPEITERLTLVCWDQLGCGANDRIIDDSFKIADFVRMTEDLVREVRKLLPCSGLYLLGMSWGSVLAALTAAGGRAEVDGVATYGQVLCNMTYNDEVYAALENSKMPDGEKKKLEELKKTVSTENTVKIMAYIRKYTEGYNCKSGEKAPVGKMLLGVLNSPDYRFKDFKAVMLNGYKKNSSLIKELLELDLRDTLSGIDIPYKIIQGDTDIVTSTRAIEEFLGECPNENLKLVKIKNSGHMPGTEAMEKIIGELEEMTRIRTR